MANSLEKYFAAIRGANDNACMRAYKRYIATYKKTDTFEVYHAYASGWYDTADYKKACTVNNQAGSEWSSVAVITGFLSIFLFMIGGTIYTAGQMTDREGFLVLVSGAFLAGVAYVTARKAWTASKKASEEFHAEWSLLPKTVDE